MFQSIFLKMKTKPLSLEELTIKKIMQQNQQNLNFKSCSKNRPCF